MPFFLKCAHALFEKGEQSTPRGLTIFSKAKLIQGITGQTHPGEHHLREKSLIVHNENKVFMEIIWNYFKLIEKIKSVEILYGSFKITIYKSFRGKKERPF